MEPCLFVAILCLPALPCLACGATVDGAYFWGATRFQYPQWLLAAMVFSNRFAERFVDQVQVVAYLHEWEPSTRRYVSSGVQPAGAVAVRR